MSIESIVVLKLGGSVLADSQDLVHAVHEIYRYLREGRRVVAVVSALGRTTDRLLGQARELCGSPEPAGLAALLATGEATSAALLSLALDRAGIPATLLEPWRVGLRTGGPLLDAEPLEINRREIFRALEERPVVVLSGFVGQDSEGRTTLLGRGGSDLTALFVAHRIGADLCRLVKDVDGLYDCDPSSSTAARRYATLTWDDALEVCGRAVQAKAIEYARRFGLSFEVGAAGSAGATVVGRGPSRLCEPAVPLPPLRVALLGLGTVGLGVYCHLAARPDRFQVVGIAVRDLSKHRSAEVPAELLSDDPWHVVNLPSDVVIEAIGGVHPASDLVEAALEGGRDVITANKAVIAHHGPRLARLARERGLRLCVSATVGGGVPVVESVERVARGARIHSVEGVLNATTNFVLDQIVGGCDLSGAVRKAQESGFAEADPSADLSGLDAAHKLVIVARAAFGVDLEPEQIERRGIAGLDPKEVRAAHLSGSVVRLVASCRRSPEGEIEAWVRPMKLPAYHPLAHPRNEENRVLIQTVSGPPVVVDGKGAGRWPTSESVFADVLDVERFRRPGPAVYQEIEAVPVAWEPGLPIGTAAAYGGGVEETL
jgi:homoserine dehydrogenase